MSVIDLANLLLIAGAADELEGKLGEVVVRLPEDVLQQMIEAGCIDPDVVPYDYADVSDDHGNDIGDATAIRVGAGVLGALHYDGDIDYFRFQAERGQSYQIDVAQGTLYDPKLDLFDSDGWLLDTNDDYGDTYASRLYWEAPSSGERYVAVKGGTGTYTLTVSLSTIVNDHGDTAEDGGGVASDRAALVALYNATEGGSWITRTNWLSGRPLDEWHGVTTDSDGRVTALDLSSNHLEGALPAALGDLSNLRALNLGGNGSSRLTGPIPAALGDLTNLESLVLNNNELTGPIPAWLGDLSNLKGLDLSFNDLTGPIPAWLGDLTNLSVLSLRANQMTGCVPVGLRDVAEENDLGELELPDCGLEGRPTASSFVSVSTEGVNNCGVKNNGSVACWWGVNEDNQSTPPAGSFASVDVGLYHTCGVRSNGSVACWGFNEDGQSTPPAGSFVSVSAGWDYTCGVRSNGSVACWGFNGLSQATPPAGSFVSVSAGGLHTCGVRSNGSVACWGDNGDGEATPPAGSFVYVSAGQGHTCGVRSNGPVACWGSDFNGRATPPAGSFVSVSAGHDHTCGVRSNGSVACWGNPTYGKATPPAGSFVSVNAGQDHTCGLRSNGSVACWGGYTP